MILAMAVILYFSSIIIANTAVYFFGPAISPINAFILIGLDFALRDWLHYKLSIWQMLALIVITSAITYELTPAAGMIAVASATSFCIAALVDWALFSTLRGSWLFRSNGSNIAGAAVDSIVFPTLAFGLIMPQIVALQFVAKVFGGALWAKIFNRNVSDQHK